MVHKLTLKIAKHVVNRLKYTMKPMMPMNSAISQQQQLKINMAGEVATRKSRVVRVYTTTQ